MSTVRNVAFIGLLLVMAALRGSVVSASGSLCEFSGAFPAFLNNLVALGTCGYDVSGDCSGPCEYPSGFAATCDVSPESCEDAYPGFCDDAWDACWDYCTAGDFDRGPFGPILSFDCSDGPSTSTSGDQSIYLCECSTVEGSC